MGRHKWSAGAHLWSLNGMRQAAAFTMNVALVASQWQHRAWS